MLVDVIEAMHEPSAPADVARNTIARFLADKREEWLSVAMLRVESTFKVKRRDGT